MKLSSVLEPRFVLEVLHNLGSKSKPYRFTSQRWTLVCHGSPHTPPRVVVGRACDGRDSSAGSRFSSLCSAHHVRVVECSRQRASGAPPLLIDSFLLHLHLDFKNRWLQNMIQLTFCRLVYVKKKKQNGSAASCVDTVFFL